MTYSTGRGEYKIYRRARRERAHRGTAAGADLVVGFNSQRFDTRCSKGTTTSSIRAGADLT